MTPVLSSVIQHPIPDTTRYTPHYHFLKSSPSCLHNPLHFSHIPYFSYIYYPCRLHIAFITIYNTPSASPRTQDEVLALRKAIIHDLNDLANMPMSHIEGCLQLQTLSNAAALTCHQELQFKGIEPTDKTVLVFPCWWWL